MMSVLALGLVLTTLLTAGFFTPTPETQKPSVPAEAVIVKEGLRTVVVEFESDDPHTKVFISPPEGEDAETAQEKQRFAKTRELVCDAYGKCKHKVAAALNTVAGKAHEAEDAKGPATETTGQVKDSATHNAHQVFDKILDSKDTVQESTSDAKDAVTHTAHQVFDKILDSKDTVQESTSDAKDAVTHTAHHVFDKILDSEDTVQESASATMEETKDTLGKLEMEGEKELGEIMRRAREVGADAFAYVFSPKRLAALSGELHLLGFAAAYGMCLWVTFLSSHVLAGALSRQQFVMVQSKIYPVYFKAMAYSVGVAISGHLAGRAKSVGMLQGFNLVGSLAMILVNLFYLEPQATKVMLERMKKEKEENRDEPIFDAEMVGRGGLSAGDVGGRREKAAAAKAKVEVGKLSEMLQKLNSCSSYLNGLTLVSLTWHLVCLGQRLHVARN